MSVLVYMRSSSLLVVPSGVYSCVCVSASYEVSGVLPTRFFGVVVCGLARGNEKDLLVSK